MKRLLLAITLCALMSAPTLAVPATEFSPGTGYWSYNGCGDLTITQDVLVDRGLGVTTDALVTDGARITLPSFAIGGAGTPGPYTLNHSCNQITIEGSGGVYFTGTLVAGNLVPVTPTSTLAGAYQFVQID